jgi:hypothetical protein
MNALTYVPEGLDEILDYYGVPGRMIGQKFKADQKWKAENLAYYGFSFPLYRSWDQIEIKGFTIHKKVGAAMIDALEEIWDIYGLGRMQHHHLDQWGGCYNPRKKRRSKELSTHAWAISLDFLPDLGPLGEPPRLPWHVVHAFTKRGFIWGGEWRQPDGMHFQACKGY